MSKQTADDLRAARKLIEWPVCWTKGHFAKNVRGHEVASGSADAVCWCADGALLAITDQLFEWRHAELRYIAMAEALERALPPGDWSDSYIAFNDAPTTTHADILALFDRAIAQEEANP